jgi:hypothetical protein
MTNGTPANTKRAGKTSSRLSLVELGSTGKLPFCPSRFCRRVSVFEGKSGEPRHKCETFSALFSRVGNRLSSGAVIYCA